jgi:hypothetical protein
MRAVGKPGMPPDPDADQDWGRHWHAPAPGLSSGRTAINCRDSIVESVPRKKQHPCR